MATSLEEALPIPDWTLSILVKRGRDMAALATFHPCVSSSSLSSKFSAVGTPAVGTPAVGPFRSSAALRFASFLADAFALVLAALSALAARATAAAASAVAFASCRAR